MNKDNELTDLDKVVIACAFMISVAANIAAVAYFIQVIRWW